MTATPLDPTAADLPETGPVILAGAETFEMTSRAGAGYRIFISTPIAPPPEGGYPVIYLLDANADFALLSESLRRINRRPRYTNVDPAVVVGIGYPGTADFEQARRMLDFTSGPSVDPDVKADAPHGGHADFLAFIEDDLKPLVARMRTIDPDRQILFGHSLGGGFTLELLAERPELFHAWVAVSPSIWWHRDRMLERYTEREVEPASRLPANGLRVMLMSGRLEEDIADWHATNPNREIFKVRKERRRMCSNAKDVAAAVARAYPSAEVRIELLDGEDHATVVPPAISRALRFVLAPVAAE